jgi:LmbE family N-acetylglucosaminyl deacetylase
VGRASGTLLCVWAHPDDEAYLSAGLMAASRDAGHRVVVATATWGESGTSDPGRWPPSRMAALRRRELTSALAAVGVEEQRYLGHRDGTCAAVAGDAATEQVASLLDEVRPDVVVTFGPDGMTGHPDHRAVSSWVTAAWRASGRSSELWYATVTPDFHRRWGSVNERVGLWTSADRPCTRAGALARRVTCAGSVLRRKLAALDAHRSQTQPLVELLGQETFSAWWSTEAFVAAAPAPHSRPSSGR